MYTYTFDDIFYIIQIMRSYEVCESQSSVASASLAIVSAICFSVVFSQARVLSRFLMGLFSGMDTAFISITRGLPDVLKESTKNLLHGSVCIPIRTVPAVMDARMTSPPSGFQVSAHFPSGSFRGSRTSSASLVSLSS